MKKFCSFARFFAKLPQPGYRETWASAVEPGRPCLPPPWIFMHDTGIVDRAKLK